MGIAAKLKEKLSYTIFNGLLRRENKKIMPKWTRSIKPTVYKKKDMPSTFFMPHQKQSHGKIKCRKSCLEHGTTILSLHLIKFDAINTNGGTKH